MKKKELYTAVGRLVPNRSNAGTTYPIVSLGGKEYGLDHQELLVWSVLCWRIAQRENIPEYYAKAVAEQAIEGPRNLDACINRLLTRGLLICGTGETEYDALYDLLASMYIIPVGNSFLLRFTTAVKLVVHHGMHPKILKMPFKKDVRTDSEQAVMALAKQEVLSAGEIIRCVDRGILHLPNEESIMSAAYDDEETTSDNIASAVKEVACAQNIIGSIANLYLRQQVIFDRI